LVFSFDNVCLLCLAGTKIKLSFQKSMASAGKMWFAKNFKLRFGRYLRVN